MFDKCLLLKESKIVVDKTIYEDIKSESFRKEFRVSSATLILTQMDQPN